MSIPQNISKLISSFLASGSTRAKLFVLELAEERQRLVKAVMMSALALLFALLGLITASICIALLFWDTAYRWWALIGVMGFHFIAALLCLLSVRNMRYSANPPFASTRETLRADVEEFSRPASSSRTDLMALEEKLAETKEMLEVELRKRGGQS